MSYYTAPGTPQIRGRLSSEEIRDQWSAIEQAFALLPPVASGLGPNGGFDGGRWANATMTNATITGSVLGSTLSPNVGHFSQLHISPSAVTTLAAGLRAWVANSSGDWRLLKESTTQVLIDTNGSVLIGDGINERSTSSSTGLFYIPTVNGTPTGTPTAYSAAAPLLYNRAADKICVFNGTWKFTAALT